MTFEGDLDSEINVLSLDRLDIDPEVFGPLLPRSTALSPWKLSEGLKSPVPARRSPVKPIETSNFSKPALSPIGRSIRRRSIHSSSSESSPTQNTISFGPLNAAPFPRSTSDESSRTSIPSSPRSPFSSVHIPPKPPSPMTPHFGKPSSNQNTLNRRGVVDGVSPISRLKFKEFVDNLREFEPSLDQYLVNAHSLLEQLPKKVRWRAYLEIGDVCRRHSELQNALYYLSVACQLAPGAPQPWLEISRLHEDCGDYKRALAVLNKCVEEQNCGFCESIILRLIRLNEKFHKFSEVRCLFFKLREENPQKSWRILVEGGLFEARRENLFGARKVFKFLMANVPHQGPIYLDAVKMELKYGTLNHAIKNLIHGLEVVSRYGPLWFFALRVVEFHHSEPLFIKFLSSFDTSLTVSSSPVSCLHALIGLSQRSLCRELVWKIRCEAAQVLSRIGSSYHARTQLALAVQSCPHQLRWKIWHVGARIEAFHGHKSQAEMLIERAISEAPSKNQSSLIIDLARIYELFKDFDRAFINLTRNCAKDWKIALELVLLLVRQGKVADAYINANKMLDLHRGTGRLWSIFVQLSLTRGWQHQMSTFKKAREFVPKSGELWCDSARMRLNPYTPKFSLNIAKKYLLVACEFTPQYGDSFIELIRCRLLKRGLDASVDDIEKLCVTADPNYGLLWDYCKNSPLEPVIDIFNRAKSLVVCDLIQHRQAYQRALVSAVSSSVNTPFASDYNLFQKWGLGTCVSSLNLSLVGASINAGNHESKFCAIFGQDHVVP
ncbi:hypothetical protein RCL1_005470 [Eukaryota sp. TZLM3-RCL]